MIFLNHTSKIYISPAHKLIMANYGRILIFYGNGKGKTTAALGTALRMLGYGKKVHLIQFMKAGIEGNKEFEEYGELRALKKFENFSFKRFGIKEWVLSPREEHINEVKKGLKYSEKILKSGKYDLVILDEILYAVQLNLIKEEDIINLIDKKCDTTELILTGSHKPLKKIFEKADLISEIRKVKHYFDRGILARKGIEF